MTNPTTPFSWQMPTASDLVTDLPADFETFGQAVATSMADLLGGTTGQVLSKASNTDMDFTWVTSDDANAIQNAIVDAKGDLIAATAADTPARLAVGTNGQVLTADSTAATGLAWAAPSGGSNQFFAGKNKIINGNFANWQRGTTFSHSGTAYTADRFQGYADASQTYTRRAFTAGTAPVAGYEGQYFWRAEKIAAGSFISIIQPIEDVRTFAGQTMTVSFWAKTDTAQTLYVRPYQNFGSGGSSTVVLSSQSITTTTSWARYSLTFSVPSISGKTIGTSSFFAIEAFIATAGAVTWDVWGVQAENGSSMTDFQTATGTIQGELAACQRYYYRQTGAFMYGLGMNASTTVGRVQITNPVSMRVTPTSMDYSTINLNDTAATFTITSATLNIAGTNVQQVACTVSSGLTQYRTIQLESANSAGYVGFNAEL